METSELLKKVRRIEIKTRGLSRNIFAPLIDYVVVQNNISRRAKRAMSNK